MHEWGDPLSRRQRREDLEREAARERLAKRLRRSRREPEDDYTPGSGKPARTQLGRILKLIKRLRSQERGIRLGGDMQKDAAKTVENEVGGWPGVTVESHSRGAGRQFRYGKIELGHLHGDSVGDLPFTKKVHDELLAQGRASTHPPLPNSGWVRRRIESPEDVTELIQLFRLNYERAKAREERRAGRVEGGEG